VSSVTSVVEREFCSRTIFRTSEPWPPHGVQPDV